MKELYDEALAALYRDDLNSFKVSVEKLDKLDGLDFIDREGRTLIFYAVLQGHLKAVRMLLSKNININLKDKNGWTPLHYAVNEHQVKIVDLLLSNGAEVNVKDGFGNTVIWRAVFASRGRGEIIKILLQKGADPFIENDSGMSAIKLSETIDNYDVKKFLNDRE